MTRFHLNRRSILTSILAFAAVPALPVRAESGPKLHVIKDPNCGCCTSWAQIVYEDGYQVSYEHQPNSVLAQIKARAGIPANMTSCHTAIVDGYAIEGHVPPADIRRLLKTRPDAVGLTVPDMPYGSPGMGPESERDAYKVYLIRRDGSTEVFADYPEG